MSLTDNLSLEIMSNLSSTSLPIITGYTKSGFSTMWNVMSTSQLSIFALAWMIPKVLIRFSHIPLKDLMLSSMSKFPNTSRTSLIIKLT